MRIDPPRDNRPALHRVGDPIAAGNYLRNMDISESNECPVVQPSIPQDHLETARSLGNKLTEMLKGHTVLADNVNLLRKIVGHFMGDKREVVISWGDLLKADPVTVKPDGRGSYTLRKES